MSGFNSQPPEGGWDLIKFATGFFVLFQLTAARRRLALHPVYSALFQTVSTHSRPKAAGWWLSQSKQSTQRFNSQPPEGGWKIHQKAA